MPFYCARKLSELFFSIFTSCFFCRFLITYISLLYSGINTPITSNNYTALRSNSAMLGGNHVAVSRNHTILASNCPTLGRLSCRASKRNISNSCTLQGSRLVRWVKPSGGKLLRALKLTTNKEQGQFYLPGTGLRTCRRTSSGYPANLSNPCNYCLMGILIINEVPSPG